MQIFFCRSVSPQAKRKQSVRNKTFISGRTAECEYFVRKKYQFSGRFTELPLDFGDVGHAEVVRDMDFT